MQLTFTSDVTAINASPDIFATINGTPVGVTDATIVGGALQLVFENTFEGQTLAVQYNPDGALSFANGGDVPLTATYVLVPIIIVTSCVRLSNTTAKVVFCSNVTSLPTNDGITAYVNGAEHTVTGVDASGGIFEITFTPAAMTSDDVTIGVGETCNATFESGARIRAGGQYYAGPDI